MTEKEKLKKIFDELGIAYNEEAINHPKLSHIAIETNDNEDVVHACNFYFNGVTGKFKEVFSY